MRVGAWSGGGVVVVSGGGDESKNTGDDYRQTFYVAETALLEGEKYLLNQYLGPWENHKRNVSKITKTEPAAQALPGSEVTFTSQISESSRIG